MGILKKLIANFYMELRLCIRLLRDLRRLSVRLPLLVPLRVPALMLSVMNALISSKKYTGISFDSDSLIFHSDIRKAVKQQEGELDASQRIRSPTRHLPQTDLPVGGRILQNGVDYVRG